MYRLVNNLLAAHGNERRDSQRELVKGTDANDENSKQALLSSKKGTIWHAVSHAHTDEGKASLEEAMRTEDKWMYGGDRGVMGETPLHLAVLFNHTEAHERVMHQLWDNYPALRTAVYEKSLYHGENVLHIAITRKLDRKIIEKFVESEDGHRLMSQRADGDFFKVPDLSDGCCNYGELPLGFAACTNQKEVFDYLVSKGAHLDFTTQEGYNLLHLMVLHSEHRSSADDDKDEDEESAKAHKDACAWARDMYDHIEEHMRKEGIYERMWMQLDVGKRTPLSLAASEGSLEMFNHLFGKLMTTEWSFGPVTCRKLYLHCIDVPLNQKSEADRAKCVMDVVVESERLDILTEGQLKKILDAKWHKYAKRKFHTRFWWAIIYASLQLLLSSTNPQSLGGPRQAQWWFVLLVLCEAWCGVFYMSDCAREIQRLFMHGMEGYFSQHSAHLFERFYALINCPLSILLIAIRWNRCLPVTSHDLRGFERLMACRFHPNLAVHPVEKGLMLCQSALSFLNIFRKLMGFPEYGHFVLMLMQMLRHDMRKFFAIYCIFLFGFSHLLYISSDLQNSGYLSFIDSMRVGFQAVLQQVELQPPEHQTLNPWSGNLVLCIVLCNFILVSLVLINLLIAMMSSTYDDINQGAKRQWNLVRARIITNIDREMTEEERINEDNIYWQWEEDETGPKGKRFMTFTTSENLQPYLASK